VVLALLATLAACGTATAPAVPAVPTNSVSTAAVVPDGYRWPIAEDKYVFIRHHVSHSGVCLEESCGPVCLVDFPAYEFDAQNQVLRVDYAFPVDDALKVVVGAGEGCYSTVSGGERTYVADLRDLPGEAGDTEVGIVQVLWIEADGTAHLSYSGQDLVLKPGERWSTTSETEESRFGSRMRVTDTDEITNLGIWEKSKIELPGPAEPTPASIVNLTH